jgi:hypothetical protein
MVKKKRAELRKYYGNTTGTYGCLDMNTLCGGLEP